MSFQLLLASDRLFFTLLLKHHEAQPIPEQIPLYNRIQVQAERPNRPAQPVMTFAYSCEKCRTGVEQDILNILGWWRAALRALYACQYFLHYCLFCGLDQRFFFLSIVLQANFYDWLINCLI